MSGRTSVDDGVRGGAGATAPPDRWWLVAGAGLLIFLAQFDIFVVTTALPTMQEDLDFGAGAAQWVLLGYLVPLIAVSLPAGRWLDQVSPRAALTLSVTGYAVTSAAAGLAPGLGWLIGARVLQGTCAAVMIAQAFTLATIAVKPSARGRSIAVVATLGPLGAVSGPSAGGYLTQTAGWPWIFFVGVPVSLVLLAISWRQAPGGRPLRAPDREALGETVTLGAATAAVVLGLFLSTGHGAAWLLVALLAVPFTLAWTRLPASRVLLDLLRRPGMAALHAVMLTVFASFLLVQFLVPFYLQQELHLRSGATGMVLLAVPVGQVALGPVAGFLVERWGARATALLGFGLLVAGTVLLVPLDRAWSTTDLVWRLGLLGIGLGLSLAPLQTMAMALAPADRIGTTSASVNVARQLGIALGPALATVLWASSGYAVGGMRLGLGVAAGLAAAAALVLVRTAYRPATH